MKILLSNDDGYRAEGLRRLAERMQLLSEIIVVAPDRNRSGASNSLTLRHPLRVGQGDDGFYYVDGTPTDCVHLAITGLMEQEPDMVVSGINSGANLGDDILYSGTVAAAMEGRFLGLPAIAVSLAGTQCNHYATAAEAVERIVKLLPTHPLPNDSILNINVPDVPIHDIKGFKVTRLGHRHKSESVVRSTDPQGEEIYWVGPAGAEQDAGPGTDFYAVRNGYISITPIQVDLTQHSALDRISTWLEKTSL